ncbi:hypothetical protein AX17_004961 [Amanita inopinata Kibby_2008]|nr:hypothetical protein AX17_004961 [Amanita inopinata Kibby_2008]
MSWSSSSYPPPRRSRSRSPRSSYPPRPPYPDSAYSGDSYRADWDAYDRDRAWASYERDRAAYDYGRRGRSRSPPPEENRKRRRSLSPYDRDRYDPRPRYNDDYDAHSRGYGGYSPRRGHPPPFPPRRAPPDPHTFDYPATLKQYAEWFRFHYPQQALDEDSADKAAEQEAGDGSKPRNGIKSRWEKYKKEFAAAQLQTMFDHHRKSPWFAEKYDPAPEFENLRTRVRKEGWKGRLNIFRHDLESGKFDLDLNEPELEPTSPIKENVSNGDTVSKEANGGTVEDSKGDDDMQFNVDADDEAGDNDASRMEASGKPPNDHKRNNRGEEISVMPEGNQVMIRTIPPDIGRVKLEEACGKIPDFVYIALGDPLQKRNFYRAGWLRFRDDADMTTVMNELSEKKIEGFKLHVTHNQRPFVNRIRFTPEVASRPERLAKDLVNAKVLAEILEDEASTLRRAQVQPLNAINAGGEEAQSNEQDVAMVPPEGEDDDPEPLERGSVSVERRIEKVMADLRDQGLVDINDEKAYEEKKVVVSLDLYLAYLRAAYHACYYCAVVTDHLEELQRKCIKHVRRPLSKSLLEETKTLEADKVEAEKKEEPSEDKGGAEKEKEKETKKDVQNKDRPAENRDWKRNDERWLEWLDSKVALLINRSGVDPREYGGKSYDEELSKNVEPYIKQEDEGKFRCKTCQKLFKATSFVEKHIANKHPDLVKYLEEIPYFNNFALDPHRIQPFTHPPPPTSSTSQGPPPQAYGIQGPPAYHGGEYGRPPYYGGGGSYGQGYPPPYHNGYWDYHAYPGGPYGPPGYPPQAVPVRRDEATIARRLSDRISGFAPGTDNSNVPAVAGLPPKPSAAALDSALLSGSGGGRRGGRNTSTQGPPPPPPPDAKEDPRAAAGKRVSYHDMDLVAEGDVELFY